MRGFTAVAALTIIAAVASSPAIAEPVQVFNLPLGGKINPSMRVCKSSEIGSSTICLLEKPSTYAGGSFAELYYPSEQLPEWAAYGRKTIHVDKSGTLDEIAVRTTKDVALSDVIKSIAMRFGAPSTATLTGTALPTATWSRPDITVNAVQWGDMYTEVHFRTLKRSEDVARYQREQEAKQRSRPVMP